MSSAYKNKTGTENIIDRRCCDETYGHSNKIMEAYRTDQECETGPFNEGCVPANTYIFVS